MAEVRVVTPGMLTTIQDSGRWGWQNQGVPVAGPMDPLAHRLANALVGNDPGASTLEVTLSGPELVFDDRRLVAVTGADFVLTRDGVDAPRNAAFPVSAGTVLRFGERRHGARSYVAVEGGIVVPQVFKSRSTHLPTRMGGLQGRALRAGDLLPLGRSGRSASPAGKRPGSSLLSVPDREGIVRVLPGPQLDRFSADALAVLQSGHYVLAPDSNRMGFRLQGTPLMRRDQNEMLSDATTLGALQVPASGQPILLMADRQTTGGYASVATVISADIGIAGQLVPGDRLSFVVTTFREALSAMIAQEQALMAVERSA